MALSIQRSSRSIVRLRHILPRYGPSVVYHAGATRGQDFAPRNQAISFGMALAGTIAIGIDSLFSPEAHARESLVQSSTNAWELTEEIGSGAFGIVRLGVRRATGELGAVKVQRDLKHRASMQREVQALQLIKHQGGHKNIVDLKDVFEKDGHMCIVTEFVSGGELFDHVVEDGPFSEDRARNMMRDIVEAVAFLHDHGVIHKDLKPENVLLQFKDKRDNNLAKLVDFGSAGPASPTTQDDIGTTVYLAPELQSQDGGPCTPAADVWSLGCILYIVLTGRHPFDLEGNATEATIKNRIMRAKVSFKHADCKGISPEAKDLITQLLQKDPSQRPSARDILQHPWMTQEAMIVMLLGLDATPTDKTKPRTAITSA
ncbi:unnamed protein product [Aphanomyces euteiches]